MKKIFFTLLLSLGLASSILGAIDTTGTTLPAKGNLPSVMGDGTFWVDSLWNGIYVLPNDTIIVGSDTTIVLDTLAAQPSVEILLDFKYDFITITVEDSGTTYTDSCRLDFASYEFTTKTNKVIESTHWNSLNFLRDSTWTNGNLAPNNDLIQTYTGFVGNLHKIRLIMLNSEVVNNRVWKFIIQAGRKK